MSDETLPASAPSSDPTGTSVEANPLGEGEAVDGAGSSQDGKFVPAERFNGLQGRLQREINTTSQLETELAALRSELEAVRNSRTEEIDVAGADELLSEILALRAEVGSLRQTSSQSVKEKFLAENPQVAAFSDLILTDDPDEWLTTATEIASRLTAATPAGDPPVDPPADPPVNAGTPTAEPPAPAAPVVAGGTNFDSEAPIAARIEETVKNKDFLGFLRASRERALLNAGGELTE